MLQERQLISRSEFDQQQAQVEAARRQYEVARNGAEQQYQALMGARARVAMARKAVADTVVRAPFDGVVGERLVSVGDYVTRGTKVASVHAREPAAPRADRAGAVHVTAVAVGSAVEPRGRRLSGRDVRRPGPLRLAGASCRTRARSSSRRSWPTPTAG